MSGSRNAVRAAIVAAIALALLLRAWGLPGRPLWLDESWSRWMAEQGWRELYDAARLYDSHPPFYYTLLKLWTGLVGFEPFAMRLLSLAAGVAMLPIAWLAAQRLEPLRREPWAAPLLLLAVAAAPALIVASRQARPYALFALAFAIALCAALSLLRRNDWRLWLVYLAAINFTSWIHGLGVLFVASLGAGLFLALALHGGLRKAILPFLAVHAVAAAAWTPCLLILIEQRRVWTDTWLRFAPADVPFDLASGLSAPGLAGLVVLALAVAGAIVLARSREERPLAVLLACTALGPAAVTIALSIVSTPVFLPRTLVPSVLPVLLLAATAVTALSAERRRLTVGAAAIALMTATAAAQVRRPAEEQWSQLASWLAARVAPGEEVWLLPNELVLPLGYARAGTQLPVRGIPAPFPAPQHPAPRYSGTMAVPGMGSRDAERLIRDARARGLSGVWILSRFEGLFDPQGSLRRALGDPAATETGFAPLIVHYYRLSPARPIPPRG